MTKLCTSLKNLHKNKKILLSIAVLVRWLLNYTVQLSNPYFKENIDITDDSVFRRHCAESDWEGLWKEAALLPALGLTDNLNAGRAHAHLSVRPSLAVCKLQEELLPDWGSSTLVENY